ncbi:MAG TPA: CBS domain-containing protein [Thermoflexia bacterium]|jgi:acetoin utilization protein AcuB|nr:CBS domain-containing protein [Thermoflexia bacterium]
MLVRDYMTRHPLMADPDMSVVEARRFMGENNLRHLPVVGEGKRLLGLVTRQTLLVDPGRLGSLNVWEIADYLSRLTLKDVMVPADEVITVGPDVPVEEAARTMVEHRVGCLPVVDENIVIGIITEVDLLAHLAEMMAAGVPAVRVTVRMPDVRGELAKLVTAVSAQGWGILALGGAPAPRKPGYWDAVVKIRGIAQKEVVTALSQVEGHEIVDVREA